MHLFERRQFCSSVAILVLIAGFILPIKVSAIVSNGANAVDLLGQYDWADVSDPQPVYTKSSVGDVPNRFGFSIAGATGADTVIDSVGHRLFLSDSNNNRVLIYNLNSNNTISDRVPDYVLGQSNFYSNGSNTTQAGLFAPQGLAYSTTTNLLYVADSSNVRVIVYDVTAITNGENAVSVLGQTTFTASTTAVTQIGLSSPEGLSLDQVNNRLFVTDINRVLVYNIASITDGEAAVNILGQSLFTVSTASTTITGMSTPRDTVYDSANQRLFVSNQGNQRITVYDVASISDGEPAVNVLNQSLFTTSLSGTTQASTTAPRGLAYDSANQRLFSAQSGSNRVTVYDVASITDGEAAVNVLGQTLYTTATAATTQAGMNSPSGLNYDADNGLLYVGGRIGNRFTVYNVASISNGEDAVDLLGQYDEASVTDPQPLYTKGTANDVPNRHGFSANFIAYSAIDTVNHRFFLSDPSNNRVLIYNLATDNTFTDRIADNVLGQSTFYGTTGAITAAGMIGPQGLAYDPTGNRLFVANSDRISVFDVASITDGEDAVNVLGQATLTSSGALTTQSGLDNPTGLAFDDDNDRLFVGDQDNNRVVVYNVASITDGEDAVNVLGQDDFDTPDAATTQASFDIPIGLAYDATNDRLFVVEQNNSRVMVFDVASISDGEDAVNVLGQEDFTSLDAVTTRDGLSSPSGIIYDNTNNRLFVGDQANNRVMVFDAASITDGEDAVNVLGQDDFVSAGAAVTQDGLSGPKGLAYDSTNSRLLVAEVDASRVTVFDVSLVEVTNVTSSASNGTYGVGDSVSIQVTFADDVTVTGTPELTLETGTTDQVATYLSGSGSDTLTFTYAVQAGDSSADLDYQSITALDLNGGTIIDGASNNASVVLPTPGAAGSLGANKAIVIDTNVSDAAAGGRRILSSGSRPKPQGLPLVVPTATPVTPAEVCQPLLTKNIIFGAANDSAEVNKLITFLNASEQANLKVDGSYDADDMVAVKKFQTKYFDQIIKPWGGKAATGIVATFTRGKINVMTCAKQIGCPYFSVYHKLGSTGGDINKIQNFLNLLMGKQLNENSYNQMVFNAVKEYQTLYKDAVLKSWNLNVGTGYWYVTSTKTANQIVGCLE